MGTYLCHIFLPVLSCLELRVYKGGRIIYLHLRVVFLSADILSRPWKTSKPPDSRVSEKRRCIYDERQRMVNGYLDCVHVQGFHWIFLLISGPNVLRQHNCLEPLMREFLLLRHSSIISPWNTDCPVDLWIL